MGAGAGAAAAVDPPELSPRGLALEEAEAELRRDLAIREERRRELEFLEKGGDPLDFKFGVALPAPLLPLSRKEPLADQQLSAGGGVGKPDSVVPGVATTSNEAIVGRGGSLEEKNREKSLEPEAAHPRVDGPSDVKVEVDSECVVGDLVGSKTQMHVKRNRARSQRLGNGHASPKVVENVLGAERPALAVESKTAPVSVENEAMSDVSYEVLPSQSSHGLPRKWAGLISSQEFESGNGPRCVPVADPPAAAADASSREPSPSHVSVQSAAARVDSNVGADERERVSPCVGALELVSSSPPHVQKIVETDGLASPKKVEDTSLVESVPGTSKEESGAIRQSGNPALRKDKKERVVPFPMEKGSDMHRVDGVHVLHADSGADVLGVPHLHRHSGVVKKAAASRGGNHGRLATRDRSLQEERRVGVHHVRIKCEDGVAENRARPSAADAEPGGQPTSGAPSCQEDLRAEGQAGAVVGGIPRAIARSSSVSALSNCKFAGVVLPRENEQDPVSQAEGERCKAERQAKADKAHDDYILEEAGNLEAKRTFMEKWHHVKKSSEPSRRKCHWDFVLEEMRWLAKDFFEERRWKLATAARIGNKVSYEKNKDDYLASHLVKEQRERASFMAYTVNKFWRMAEASLTKGKPGRFICDKSAKAEEPRNDSSEAVPMDVDVPASTEAVNKSSQPAKLEENSFPVKRYAVNYLKVIGCGRVAQAVAPITPDHYFECNGIPYFFDEDLFSKELLYYTVPAGAMEVYRVSVEMERARAEVEYEEKRATAVAEAEALVSAEASGDASLGSDFGFSDFLVDGGSQDYEFQTSFMGEGGHARISKKKRKKIFKNSNSGRRLEGIGLQGFSYPSSGMSTPDMGLQSPLVTGKRSLPGELVSNSVPGSIPVKRARSSATNLRPRASHSCISPGGYPRTGLDSQDQHEDDGLGMAEGSMRLESGHDTSSGKLHGVGGMGGGGFASSKLKKKKKTKAFPGLSNSRPYEGGLGAGPPGKGGDGDSQDLVRFEQMKRKVEPNWAHPGTSSDASLGTPTDTPGSPGSQGLPGQQTVKKQKSLKQNETSCEAATPAQALPSVATASKLLKQSSMRDRNRRARPNKVPTSTPAGVGIPWSTSEDQAILALVHDLGPNFELVSDVLSSNSQIKGIFRKPKQCRERHVALTERSNADAMDNQEDPNSLQSQCSKGNVKGPRVHGVPEEDSLKHLECIVQLVSKYRVRKISSDSQDQKTLAAQHPSHGIAISQFCTGGPPNPLDLCDRVTSNGDATSQPFPIQPAQGGSVLGPPMIPGSVMRPPSGGLPLLPGTSGFNLGPSSVSSSAAMSAAAARDAQRFTTRLSQEEANRLRMAGGPLSAYNARLLQQQAVPGGLPLLTGLPSPSDLSMVPTSSTGAMLGALSRGLSLPRAGMPSMGSPVVSNLAPAGLSGMVPPAGPFSQSSMSRRTANLLNMLRGGTCSEEQRVQILQHLQMQAQQGDNQAAAALSNISSDMAAMTSPPPQPFSPQHQPLQQQQQQQHFQAQPQPQQQVAQHQQHQQVQNQQRNQLQQQQQHMQMQANPTQAYYAAAARMKEHQHRQQQQQQQQQTLQQQHQQKQRMMGTLPQAQHMLAPPHVPSLPPQQLGSQSHLLSQQPQHTSIPKQVGPQQGVGPPPGLGPSAPASPAGSGQSNPPNQASEQLGQSTGSSKPAQGKQTQTPQTLQQLPSPRNSTAPSRGGMTHDLSSQTGQASTFGNSGNNQPVSETLDQMQQLGQKMHQRSGQAQAGSASSGPPSKGPQQSDAQPQLQMPQGGVPKQQQGASVPTAGQAASSQAASIPISSPQLQQPLAVPSAQQMQRSQAPQAQQQLQQPQRRLQTRHLSANPLGMAMPGLLGKTGLPPTVPTGSSQMSALPNHNPYQLGGTAASIGNPISLSNSTSHGLPLHSSTIGAHSMQWKPNQVNSPLSAGLYNLTRANNAAGTGPVSGTTTPGLQLPSFHGPSHVLPLGSMAQGPLVGVSGPQKHGMSPGVNGRAPSGAQPALPPGPRSSQANGSLMVSSAPSANPATRPPAGGLGPGGAASTVPYVRVPASESGNSMASPMLANSGQAVSSSGVPISQRPVAAAAASAVSVAIGGSPSSGISTLPPGGPGPGLPEATTPVSSS